MTETVPAVTHDGLVFLDSGGTELTATGTFIRASRIALLHGFSEGEVYRNGHNSWSPTGWKELSSPPLRVPGEDRRRTADDPVWDDPIRHHSSWVISVSHGDRAILVGCLAGENPRLHADRDLVSAWSEDGEPAEWVVLVGAEMAVFDDYRRLLKARYGARDRDPGGVWSSWYSFYENISARAMEEMLPALPSLGFETVQIDDGWERRVGDWHPNEKFPAGMKDLATRIADRGMRPGLWVAPFIALPDSEIAREYPSMFLTDTDGAPVAAGSNWGSGYFTLDLTRSDARDFLSETIGRLVHDWGYSYLKLDFINSAVAVGRHSVPIGREAAYREGISLIREIAGPETFLLGSGAPVFASLGILDAVRTGPDVAPMWNNYATDDPSDATARNAYANAVSRLWLRGLIGLDPDAAYFRRQRNLLNDEQMHALRDAAIASGFRAVSDPPEWIDVNDVAELQGFLRRDHTVQQVSRWRYRIDGRLVDFARMLGESSPYPL